MWRCVDIVLTDVSEERIAYVFKVQKSAWEEPVWIGELQPPVHAGSLITDFYSLKMDAVHSLETFFYTISTQCHIPEDGILPYWLSCNLFTYFYINGSVTDAVNISDYAGL
jgi:hypothetical protein